MSIVAWTTALLLAGAIGIQLVLVLLYRQALLTAISDSPDRSFQPPAAVILCLRGADPSLPRCLAALADQDYAGYQVVCVLDHGDDPAGQVIGHSGYLDHPRFRVLTAGQPGGQCSLKCNALVTALDQLDPAVEVVALVDADCEVDRQWLADLVAPLVDRQVAVATGNRWFSPERSNPGTLVRYLWHMAAAVQMYVYRIPWGGSLAFRRELVEEAGLKDRWASCLFEDTMLGPVARQLGRRVVVIPGLLVPNRESIGLKQARVWIRRQLLNMRLYHPAFPLAVGHCLGTASVLLATTVLGLQACWNGDGLTLAVMAAGGVLYVAFYAASLVMLRRAAAQVLQHRHQEVEPPLPGFGLAGAVALTQVVYCLAMLGAFRNRIRWRGIDYRIEGPARISLSGYRPIEPVVSEAARSIEQ